mmetsp:Transcript_13002/g.37214  ORF Transcript_13002/g.37214 Transcript_13002/m.37214 type:complete len:266 (+) Transcript_13002:1774-2571(+)
MLSGKLALGSEVSHSRKRGANLACSMSASSTVRRRLRSRWQFCRSTHLPAAAAVCRSLRITASSACPIERGSTSTFRCLARSRMSGVGSEPGERRVRMGVSSAASLSTMAKPSGRDSTKRFPSVSITYLLMHSIVRSSRMQRTSSIVSKVVTLSAKSGGRSSSGASSSNQCFHRMSLRLIASTSSAKTFTLRDSIRILSQVWSAIHEKGFGFSEWMSRELPALKRTSIAGPEMRPSRDCMRSASISVQMLLCCLKRPRCTRQVTR